MEIKCSSAAGLQRKPTLTQDVRMAMMTEDNDKQTSGLEIAIKRTADGQALLKNG